MRPCALVRRVSFNKPEENVRMSGPSVLVDRNKSGRQLLDVNSYNLFSQSSPVGSAYLAAGEGACGEGHDLVDLAAGDFHFHGGV